MRTVYVSTVPALMISLASAGPLPISTTGAPQVVNEQVAGSHLLDRNVAKDGNEKSTHAMADIQELHDVLVKRSQSAPKRSPSAPKRNSELFSHDEEPRRGLTASRSSQNSQDHNDDFLPTTSLQDLYKSSLAANKMDVVDHSLGRPALNNRVEKKDGVSASKFLKSFFAGEKVYNQAQVVPIPSEGTSQGGLHEKRSIVREDPGFYQSQDSFVKRVGSKGKKESEQSGSRDAAKDGNEKSIHPMAGVQELHDVLVKRSQKTIKHNSELFSHDEVPPQGLTASRSSQFAEEHDDNILAPTTFQDVHQAQLAAEKMGVDHSLERPTPSKRIEKKDGVSASKKESFLMTYVFGHKVPNPKSKSRTGQSENGLYQKRSIIAREDQEVYQPQGSLVKRDPNDGKKEGEKNTSLSNNNNIPASPEGGQASEHDNQGKTALGQASNSQRVSSDQVNAQHKSKPKNHAEEYAEFVAANADGDLRADLTRRTRPFATKYKKNASNGHGKPIHMMTEFAAEPGSTSMTDRNNDANPGNLK